jgi:gliding motility-associated-like protein
VSGIQQAAVTNGTGNANEVLTNISSPSSPVQVTYNYKVTANSCINPVTYPVVVTVYPTPPTPIVTPASPVSFCAGSSVTLSAPGGYSYQWSNGVTTQSIVVSIAGSYSVVLTDATGCQSAPSNLVNVTSNASATANAGLDGSVCEGGTFIVAGAYATNFQTLLWSSTGTGSFINNGTLTPSYLPSAVDVLSGSVVLTLTATDKVPCSGTVHDDLILTIQPKPKANAGADNTVCYPNAYTVTGSSATNYGNPVWTHNGTGVLTNINTTNPTYHPAASDAGKTVELTLTVDGITPCATPVHDHMLLSVGALPGNPGAIVGTNPVCQGVTETYSVTSIAQATGYTWAVPAGATIISGSNTNTIEVQYSVKAISGNITVYGTNGCGNGPVSTLPVVVNTVPANPGNISGNALVCQGTSGVVYFVTPVTGATSYFWTLPTGANIVAGSGTNSVTVDFDLTASSGNVTVYAINSATNCGNGPTSIKPVVVNAKPSTPVISAVGGPTTFCEGGSVALMGAPAGYNYVWTPAGVTTQVNLATASGSYSVVVSDPVTGCSSGPSNSIDVTVNPAPAPPTSVGFVKHCYLSTPASPLVPPLDARDVTTVSTGSIVWFDAATGGHVVVSPTLATLGSITYYAEARAAVTNCPSLTRTPVTLNISTNPDIPVKGPDVVACETIPATILTATTLTAPPAGTTITWYTSPTGGLPVSPTLSSVGTRTLYAEASNGTCTSNGRSEGVVLTINPAPIAPVSGGNITQCIETTPHTLTATATAPAGVSISWWTLSVGGSPVVPTLSSGVVGSKTFYAEATNDLTLCQSLSRTPVTISVVALPALPVVNPAGVTTICETSTITPLDANNAVMAAPAGYKLNWYNNAGNIVASPVLSSVGTTTYYAESENLISGCKGPRLAVTLTINPAPAVPTSFGTATKCAEAVLVPLTATATATGSTIVWYTLPSGGTPITGTPVLSNIGTITYYAEAKDPATGCASLGRSAPVVLTINATPAQPTTLKAEDRICQGSSSTTLTATASVAGGANVVWYNAASGGSVVTPATLSIPGTVTYWAEAVLGTCKSPSPRTTSVKLTIDPAPAPPVFSEGEKKKCYDGLALSVPTVSNVEWFENPTGGDALSTLPSLTNPESKTFYAEAINSTTLCRSLTRTAYKLTIQTTPVKPISGGDQVVCAGIAIPTLTATATSQDPIKWYSTAVGGASVSNPTWNSIGTKSYWAESDNGACPSTNPTLTTARTEVKLTINPAPVPPTAKAPLTICANDPLISTATFNDRLNNSNVSSNYLVEWFDGKDAPNPIDHIPTFAELSPGKNTFWAGYKDQTTTCQSQIRTEVIVTINALPLAPISKGDVTACALKPVQVIKAEVETPTDGAKITWYTAATGGSLVAMPTLNRITSITFYAQAELGTCINPTRTAVKLTINPIAADPVLQTAGVDSLVSCEAAPIVAIDAKTLFTNIPGTTYVAFDAALDGVEVPTVLDYVGTKELYIAAKNVLSECTSSKRIPVKLIIHPAPEAPVSKGDLTDCAKSPADTLNANAAIVPDGRYKLLWYDKISDITPRTAPPVLTLASGKLKDTITYYASYKDTITGCETIAKRTAVLLTLNTATASASSNGPLSLGQTLLLKGGPELAGNTFLWTDPHGFGFSTMDVTIPNVTGFAAGMYKLTVTSLSGCIATDSVLVELDIAHAEAQKPVCLGGTLYLSGYPSGMKSYAWSGPNGWTSPDQNPSINNVAIANTGTYTLTVTSFNNATSSDTVSVAFKALPIPIAQAVTVCPSGLLQLKASPGGMTSYTWSDENGAIIDTIQNLAPRPYPVNPAKFKLTVVDWNGCEASTSITPKVFQPTITSNSPICSGDTLRLRAEPNGMASYRWSGPNNFNSTLQSPSLNNVTAATGTGKYILTVVDKGGCTYSNSIDVSFNPAPPAATIVYNMNPICEGSTLILNGGPSGMTSYNWTGPNGFTYLGQDPQIPAVTAANAGKYTLKIVTPLGCKSSFETTISVSSVNFNGTYGPYCITESPVTLSVSPGGGTFTGPGISGTTFDPRVAGVGTHAIQYTYSPAGVSCQIIATKMIDVVSVPKIVITNPILKSCSGTTEDLTLPKWTVGSTPGLIYTYWTDSKATSLMPSPKTAKAGLYYIKGATPSGKCSDIQPVMVMQPDSLRATLTQIAALNCAGDTTGRLAVKVTMGTAPYTYLWSTTPAQVKDTAINLRSGIYTVVVTDAKFCTSSFTGEIKEPAPLKLGFTVKPIQCASDANGSARVDTINGNTDVVILNSYDYYWDKSPVKTTREAVRLKAYWHQVKLVSPKGCSQKDSVFIDVLDVEPPTMVCPKNIEMTVQYIKSPDPNKYKVDLGKPYAMDNCQVDTLTNDAPAMFRAGETIVVWTVTDQVGLMDTCHQRIFIKELPTIPQLISPNGDGVNDFFIIDGLNSADYSGSQMAIYTRSGQLVFQSNNYELPENAWDGRYKESGFSKDKLVAPGVYYYILKLGGNGGQTLKGYVYVYY